MCELNMHSFRRIRHSRKSKTEIGAAQILDSSKRDIDTRNSTKLSSEHKANQKLNDGGSCGGVGSGFDAADILK